MGDQLLPLQTERTVHLCVDMQRIFGWTGSCQSWGRSRTAIPRELFYPLLQALARCDPRAPGSPAAGVDAAASGALPARDRYRQNTLLRLRLIEHLRQRETDALIVSGSETDVCVLATVLDAVDIGYRSSCATPYAALLTKGTECSCGSTIPDIRSRSRRQTPRQSSRGGNDFRSGVKPPGRAD